MPLKFDWVITPETIIVTLGGIGALLTAAVIGTSMIEDIRGQNILVQAQIEKYAALTDQRLQYLEKNSIIIDQLKEVSSIQTSSIKNLTDSYEKLADTNNLIFQRLTDISDELNLTIGRLDSELKTRNSKK